MRTIYIDSDFKCHVANDGTLRTVETEYFDGKCDIYVEGYRFVPDGETWVRNDGVQFIGEMVTPWKDIAVLAAAQTQHEKDSEQMADMENALAILLGGESA